MDRSADRQWVVCVGRKDIQKSLLAQGGFWLRLCRRFLARLDSISDNRTATVWEVAGKKVQTLDHEGNVRAAKYSPQGDRIATATWDSVRVWDVGGRSLVRIPVKVTPYYNAGLFWSSSHLFVVAESTIKQFEASTGSTVSEWLVPRTDGLSCIALPKHGEFIAYSTDDTVTFWDTSTRAQLGLIQLSQSIHSIALSPDDPFLATGGKGGKITVRSLRSRITVSIVGASRQFSYSACLSK